MDFQFLSQKVENPLSLEIAPYYWHLIGKKLKSNLCFQVKCLQKLSPLKNKQF